MRQTKKIAALFVPLALFLCSLNTINAEGDPAGPPGNAVLPEKSLPGTEGKTPRVLSFREYLDIISSQLPELRENQLRVDRSKNDVYAATAVDDLSLEGDFKYSDNDVYSAADPDHAYGTDGYTLNTDIGRTVSRTGSRIATGVEYSDSADDTVDNGRRYYTPSTYVKLTQPILYNAFGLVDRFAEKDAGMQLAIDEIQRREDDEEDMNYYKNLYFDWIRYHKRLAFLKKIIANAEELVGETRAKYESGLKDNDDVQEVVVSLLGYREQYSENQRAYDTIISELAIFFDTSSCAPDFGDFDAMFDRAVDYEFDDVPFSATRNSEIYELMKEKLVYSKKVYTNKLLPEVDLVGKYNFKSSRDDFDTAAGDIGEDNDYYVGFSVSIPLGNTERKSDLNGILLDIDEVNHNYDISKNAYTRALGDIRASAAGKKSVFEIKEQTVSSLESKYATEKEKYGQGRLNLRYVVETENSVVSGKIDLIDLKKEIIGLYFDYADLTD